MQKTDIDKSRRQFLKIGLIAGTGLVVSAQLFGCSGNTEHFASPGVADTGSFIPNAWIKIRQDDSVTVMVNHSEMGQGISTALPMIVAEELEADWSKVRFEIAPVADVYKHPTYGIQWTVSSMSVESSWDLLRKAGATARELLISSAAETWGVPRKECRAETSQVIHKSSGRVLRYGELINKAAGMPIPESVRLKNPNEFKIIGRPIHRLDNHAKIDGSAQFGIDVRLPGMLTATVVHPPVFGSGIKSINRQATLALPGVKQLFPVETGVAIVTDTFWRARVAMETLEVEWEDHENQHIDSEQLFERWAEMGKQEGKVFFETGDIDELFENAETVLEATYNLPYQAHATPEPMNCTADVREKSCEIWVPTQNQKGVQEIAARITGLDNSAVKVHTTFLGGGFGRRALVDYAGEAVEISKKMKAPIKVIWTREEDIRRDYYRPATHNVMKAVIDRHGKPLVWLHRIVGADVFGQALPKVISGMLPDAVPRFIKNTATSLAESLMPRLVSGKKAIIGAGPLPYSLENMRVEFINDDPGIPICWWRSVAPSSNCFAVECFIDEIAAASNRDPYELRCDLLAQSPRLLHVLTLAAEKAGWYKTPAKGIHRGIACHNFQNTMMAMVAEVSVNRHGEIKVHRVVCALDCGIAINPKTIEAQVQSAVVFGLTATIKSSITIQNGKTMEGNFDDFPILRMDEMPVVTTYIVPSTKPPTGIGEVGVPVISPAVANAVFAATGKRIRKLHITPEDLRQT
ncbi:molybdopterin cofactor-binding domain-containing protein [Thermodesulfobacteriota bacterium]